jgi:glycine oxidase
MKDLIIVGRGLAAHVLAHHCEKNKLSFTIIGNPALSSCSQVAAGIWNPIVFKRLTKSWMAETLINYLGNFYAECEKRTGEKFVTKRNFFRPFSEEQEKELWKKRSANELEDLLDQKIVGSPSKELSAFHLQMGYGNVLQSGNLDLKTFLAAGDKIFSENIVSEKFDHSRLKVSDAKVVYNGTEAKALVFCEGYLVKDNPFFSFIPLKPVKGEILEIESDLPLQNGIVNKGGFLMDVEKNKFKAGATYDWNYLNDSPTEKGKIEIEKKIRQITSSPYKITAHKAGVRPSSLDRRPIIGQHPLHPNLHVFNGLGTKGVMLAPYFANNFVNFLLQKEALHPEINVKRFYHLYAEQGSK